MNRFNKQNERIQNDPLQPVVSVDWLFSNKHPNNIKLNRHLVKLDFVFQSDIVEDVFYLPFELGK